MDPIRLQVVIPFHQPLAAESDAIEHAVSVCYEPILVALEEAAKARVAVHFSGHLLDHLSRKREDFLMRLKALARAGRVEILGGLFYGSLPALLPEADVRAQVQMTAEYWESFIGRAPSGFWLPELAWTAELPRMLDETGVDYGFISAGQTSLDGDAQYGLVTIERGGAATHAFVLADKLSKAALGSDASEWAEGAVDNMQRHRNQVHTVWLRAEALGLEGSSQDWARAWLPEWLEAVSGGRGELSTVLPSESYATARPARPVKLLHRCAEVVGAADGVDWPDFALQFPEVDALHRRMLRASDKLREAIATMEEEAMEEEWSSDLATAQRCIFSAQAPDAYWRGRGKGFADPKLRDAVMTRLTRAERLIDALVQGEDDWISAEEEDRDGDLVDEVLVSSRHLAAWIIPGEGARVRTLDDRLSGRNVFDVGSVEREKPTTQGMREMVLDAGTSAEELFSGSAKELAAGEYEQRASAIDEDGDLTYHLEVTGKIATSGHTASTIEVTKSLGIAIDKAELTLNTKARVTSGQGVLLATRIPVRLGDENTKLLVNGSGAKAGVARHDDVRSLRVEGSDGSALDVTLAPAMEVWTAPASREDASQGFILVPILRVESGDAESRLSIQLSPAAQHLEQAADDGEEEYEEEYEGEEDEVDQEDEDTTIVPGD